MAEVVSDPFKELPLNGQNAKYIKECTELYLSGKGITKLRGFEPFVNLESLWLNNNKLKKINNLDAQVRLKAVYAQDNLICTLKGSLACFKFLETLDLSNNQLRDLDKQLKALEKFVFIRDLNLQGNPMCEEPDYRLLVVHRMPGLKVLDQHVVTAAERRKAQGLIGGDVATLTVAFGNRVPPYDPAWDDKVPDRSQLEQSLVKEAATIRDTLRHDAYMRERGMFLHDPHPEPSRGGSLPPNAGTVRAMRVWQQQTEQQQQQGQGQGQSGSGAGGPSGAAGGAVEQAAVSGSGASGRRDTAGLGASSSGRGAAARTGGRTGSLGRSPNRTATGGELAADNYAPRDKLVLYSLRAGQDPLEGAATATATQPASGMIKFEQEQYERFLQQRAAGAGGWQMSKAVVEL